MRVIVAGSRDRHILYLVHRVFKMDEIHSTMLENGKIVRETTTTIRAEYLQEFTHEGNTIIASKWTEDMDLAAEFTSQQYAEALARYFNARVHETFKIG